MQRPKKLPQRALACCGFFLIFRTICGIMMVQFISGKKNGYEMEEMDRGGNVDIFDLALLKHAVFKAK